MKASSGNRQKDAFGVVNISPRCIIFIASINESVQYHIATKIMSFPSIAPIECPMLSKPAPFLMQLYKDGAQIPSECPNPAFRTNECVYLHVSQLSINLLIQKYSLLP